MTCQAKAWGMHALGIDHFVDKKRVKAAVAKLDLLDPSHQQTLFQQLNDGKVACLLAAPPCGTSSAARSIRIRGVRHAPRPLRSQRFPYGFPWAKGTDAARVKSANQLYIFTCMAAALAHNAGALAIIENPENSLMWLIPEFQCLLQLGFRLYCFDSCMHGSRRPKKTAFLANFDLSALCLRCDRAHQHLPWKTRTSDGRINFMTSHEAEYPLQLCQATVALVAYELKSRGFVFSAQPDWEPAQVHLANLRQPRGLKSPALIPEFKLILAIRVSSVFALPSIVKTPVPAELAGVPDGAVLLTPVQVRMWGDLCTSSLSNAETAKVAVNITATGQSKLVHFGVLYSPDEFLSHALRLDHPFDCHDAVSAENRSVIDWILREDPAVVKSWRLGQLKKYLRVAAELAGEEKQLHESMHPDVERVMKSKRLLLFKRMLEDSGNCDADLFKCMVEGFPLVGHIQFSGQFPRQWKPAALSMEALKKSSTWSRKAISASCRRVAEDREIASAVWDETLQQVSKGWLTGPYTESQLDDRHSGVWIPSKRFGVRQGGKIRAVDDCSEFLINDATSVEEKLDLEGIDQFAAFARFWASEALRLQLQHTGCSTAGDLKGRCMDLKAAYKQLARNPNHGWASIIAVLNPTTGGVCFFESVALPFGASSAVISFNRTARALRDILIKLFCLPNTNFFDDYGMIECSQLCENNLFVTESVMKLLGWEIAQEERKRLPFSKNFAILGAMVSLGDSHHGIVEVSNKPERLPDIKLLFEELSAGRLPLAKLASLRGKMLYAASHTFGRMTHLAVQLLSRLDSNMQQLCVLAPYIAEAIELLSRAGPRVLRPLSEERPILLFTDGACEQEGELVTHGAVFVDPDRNLWEFFGDKVPQPFLAKWRESGHKQLIAQAELLPVVVAKKTWAKNLRDRKVLIFIDNESVKSSLVRSYSPSIHSLELLRVNAWVDAETQSWSWYTRVPSGSNIADDASRLAFGRYDGWTQVHPNYDGHAL